ncbi:unnamed protein product [Sphenostylis stenocarpa]|uniref:Uncharacterized protein n=1 Tax=Sphenostylis stenocarpa TaxID=92480 RepID=A0AA86SFE5_9FABA|nr:unnamed protein product [Sphenostylis stenocarpa]
MPSIYVKSVSCLLSRPKWNGMALLVTLRPGLSPHIRSSPPATQEVGFANTTTLGSSPSFYVDPGPGWLLGSPFPPRSRPGWPSSGSGNSPVPRSKTWLDAGSTPRGAVRTVVSTGCFRAARLTPIRISSSKVPYPYARIIE